MRLYSDSIYYECTLHQYHRKLPVLLMLHGFMGTQHVFDPYIEQLSEFCNPLTIDLAGHGKTITPDNTELFTAERQTRQIISVINRLSFEVLYLFGYSMGGRLAFQLVAHQPDMFTGAIVESSHCGTDSKKARKQRIRMDQKRAKMIETDYTSFLNEWQDMPLFAHTPGGFRKVYYEIMSSQKPELMSASLKGFGAGVMPPVCRQISNVKIPLQLIAGERDKKYVKLMAEISANHPNSNFTIAENAGHRVHTDRPDEWIGAIRKCILLNTPA
jgi:2-succinyl-6-hydroxy-2,4-cyclohexadiene-1-carboxylate synthase